MLFLKQFIYPGIKTTNRNNIHKESLKQFFEIKTKPEKFNDWGFIMKRFSFYVKGAENLILSDPPCWKD